MAFTEINTEQKVSISISSDAFAVLKNDMAVTQETNKTTFINNLIDNFKDDAEASISKSKDSYKHNLQDNLNQKELTRKLKSANNSTTEIENIFKNVINTLTESYIENIRTKKYSDTKARTFKIRLNNKNYEYLTTYSKDDIYYSGSIGKYISTLIEEYCSKPYVKREKIYNKKIFKDIEDACGSSIITLKMKNKQIFTIKPCRIITDSLSMYHYIIGYSVTPDNYTNAPDKTFSCRITHIDSVEDDKQNFSLTSEEKARLNKELHIKGAQFMCEEVVEYTIYLTDKGIDLYNRMLHLRPKRINTLDNNKHIYTFRCSKKQIEFYFFKFGAEAIILSPPDIRNSFIEKYHEAINSYETLYEQFKNI